MKRSSILAHRGAHSDTIMKNSKQSILAAVTEGFGLETDLRDFNTALVISHDPPSDDESLLHFDWFIDCISSESYKGRLAMNIKSDGLSDMIALQMTSGKISVDQFYVFDMSSPDSLQYIKNSIPLYTRISDLEPHPVFLDKAVGIWVDNFTGNFKQVDAALHYIDLGYRVALVSSELHGRPYVNLWNEIENSKIFYNPLFELCTDFPLAAANRFCNSPR
jgi:glycerophosphoryl diester phosphodiesterase